MTPAQQRRASRRAGAAKAIRIQALKDVLAECSRPTMMTAGDCRRAIEFMLMEATR